MTEKMGVVEMRGRRPCKTAPPLRVFLAPSLTVPILKLKPQDLHGNRSKFNNKIYHGKYLSF